jgi:hypothetical protein
LTQRTPWGIAPRKLEEVGQADRAQAGLPFLFFARAEQPGHFHMTISASKGAADRDRLVQSLDLYRDLSVALGERIARLRADPSDDANCKESLDAIKAHQRALQTVIDLEGSLEKRRQAWVDGTCTELDLGAAREEIRAKLAVWASEGSG